MKKLLLFSACAALATAAYAQNSSDYYTVSYKGEELGNGDTIICTDGIFENFTDQDGNVIVSELNFECDVNYQNVLTNEYPILLEVEQVSGDFGSSYYQICYQVEGGISNCLLNPPYQTMLPGMFGKPFAWQLHVYNALENGDAVYKLTSYACEGGQQTNGLVVVDKVLEDTAFVVYVKLQYEDAGVESIGSADDSAPVYFDLQGRRVNNPSKGIFVVKEGKKVSKRIIR